MPSVLHIMGILCLSYSPCLHCTASGSSAQGRTSNRKPGTTNDNKNCSTHESRGLHQHEDISAFSHTSHASIHRQNENKKDSKTNERVLHSKHFDALLQHYSQMSWTDPHIKQVLPSVVLMVDYASAFLKLSFHGLKHYHHLQRLHERNRQNRLMKR